MSLKDTFNYLPRIGNARQMQLQLDALNDYVIQQANEHNLRDLETRNLIAAATQAMLEALVRSRIVTPPVFNAASRPPEITGYKTLLEYEEELKSRAALAWDAYQTCLNAGTNSYETLPAESCSTENHPQAHLFRAFLRPYLHGNILDIGCGPQQVPFYLEGYPLEAISGIDPISSASDHPFQFVSGYGEILPWRDESFDVVISGTVLDHYVLLDDGLAEVFRVLKPGGRFVAWITHFEDAPEYTPYVAGVKPYDSEHMYHINLKWFVPLMKKIGFREVEILEFQLPFKYLFMSFEKPDSGVRVLTSKSEGNT